MIYPVALGLLEPFTILFGKLMNLIYNFIGNYGWSMVIFAVITKALFIPLFVKSQKGMLKQQALQDDINEIKRLYPKDMQKQQQLTQEVYKANNISMGAGCLTSLIPLLLIFPMFTIARNPLQYISGLSSENLTKIVEYLQQSNIIDPSMVKTIVGNSDIHLIGILKSNTQALAHVIQEGWLRVDQLIDTHFYGLDLGMKPSWHPADLFGPQSLTYLSLLILPIVCVVTIIIQLRISNKSLPQQMSKAERQRENRNPAKAGQTPKDQGAGMMKTMQYTMPIMMLVTMFIIPSALGLYYVISNIMAIIQSAIIYKFYTEPFRAQLAQLQGNHLIRRR